MDKRDNVLFVTAESIHTLSFINVIIFHNGTEHVRHPCSKITVLYCRRCLIFNRTYSKAEPIKGKHISRVFPVM
jgi:hypothetical protein